MEIGEHVKGRNRPVAPKPELLISSFAQIRFGLMHDFKINLSKISRSSALLAFSGNVD